MSRPFRPLEIVVYQDVLCAWCYVAEVRLDAVRRELGDSVRWRLRPYPLRVREAVPSQKEIAAAVAELQRARLEPEGARLSTELWTGADPPRSSVIALAALEAARLQGRDERAALSRAMQHTALEQGVNVTRTDVVLEIASGLRLDMNRFATAFESPRTRDLVLEEHRLAVGRGVKGVPTLVIGNRWMICGLKEVGEYRENILECVRKNAFQRAGDGNDQLLH